MVTNFSFAGTIGPIIQAPISPDSLNRVSASATISIAIRFVPQYAAKASPRVTEPCGVEPKAMPFITAASSCRINCIRA